MLVARLAKSDYCLLGEEPLLIILSGGFLDAALKQQSFKAGI